MKSTIKNFILITIPTLLILFFVVEVVVRITFEKVDVYQFTGLVKAHNPMNRWATSDSYSAYKAKPGIYSKGKTVNSHGFISTPEIKLKKEENTTRVLFLGGSSTAGTGWNLPDKQTWPWKTIEKLITSQGQNIDFINGALGGYSTFESYGKLWSRLRFFKPDIVILNHGWNEMYYFNRIANNPLRWKQNFDVKTKKKIEEFPPLLIDEYIRWSQALTRTRIILGSNQSKQGELAKKEESSTVLGENFNKKGLDIYRQNLLLIKQFCDNNSIKLYVCKQPSLITNKTSKKDKLRCKYKLHRFNHNAHIRAYNEIYSVINEEIQKPNIIDLTSLSGMGEYFNDHVHPTEFGTDKISDMVSAHVLDDYFKNGK